MYRSSQQSPVVIKQLTKLGMSSMMLVDDNGINYERYFELGDRFWIIKMVSVRAKYPSKVWALVEVSANNFSEYAVDRIVMQGIPGGEWFTWFKKAAKKAAILYSNWVNGAVE